MSTLPGSRPSDHDPPAGAARMDEQSPRGPGEPESGTGSGELFQLLYSELRAVAQKQLAHERVGHTLNATALVHEAFAKLGGDARGRWKSRAHFCAVAAQAMRRVLVDHARARKANKRGGTNRGVREDLTLLAAPSEPKPVDVLVLDEALTRLAAQEPVAAQVVEMQFFAGLDQQAIAEALDITDRTVRRHWTFAKAWLYRELSRAAAEDGAGEGRA